MNPHRITAAVSHLSYRMFAKRYGIRLMKKHNGRYIYRSPAQLKTDIYNFEKKNKPLNGMYF